MIINEEKNDCVFFSPNLWSWYDAELLSPVLLDSGVMPNFSLPLYNSGYVYLFFLILIDCRASILLLSCVNLEEVQGGWYSEMGKSSCLRTLKFIGEM